MLKLLKMTGILIGSLIAVLIIIAILFINFSPQFGKKVSKSQKVEYSKSENHQNGIFVNRNPAIMKVDFWDMLKKMAVGSPYRQPKENIPAKKIDSLEIVNHEATITQLTWFGHSTFLLEIEGKKILIDPMFGNSPSPLPLLGAKRYSKELPIQIEKLPYIDAVILSHDHYDHLDYESIQKLKGKVGQYYTPLGLANHLTEWGVSKEKIHELNWWESVNFEGIELLTRRQYNDQLLSLMN